MNVEMDSKLELKNKKFINIFCTLFLQSNEFAINISEIQEVVNYPEKVNPMPLAPEYLIGIFNLRNMVIPIIDLNLLLNITKERELESVKVAIIDYDGAKIGLIFDSTGEVLRVSDDVKNNFNYLAKEKQVISGVLRISEERLLQVINTKALFMIENIPHIFDYQKKFGQAKSLTFLKTDRKKAISFSVQNLKLAFEISGIFEIVKIDEVKNSALVSDLCLGYIHLRNFIVPLIDFSKILGIIDHKSNNNNRRAVVLKIDHEFFGLVVDSVDSINTFTDENVLPIPILSKNRVDMFKGCLSINNQEEIFLLEESKIFTNDEIMAITQGHSKLYSDQLDKLSESKKGKGLKQTFITFRLNNLFGVEIKEIREIINFSSEIFEAPGMPDFVFGMLNLRGKLVTIIDMRELYHVKNKNQTEHEKCKILIFQVDSDLTGFIVDAVESIVHVDDSNRMKLPDIFLKSTSGSFQQDVKEVIEIPGPDDKRIGLIVINKDKLILRIQNQMSQKSEVVSLKILESPEEDS